MSATKMYTHSEAGRAYCGRKVGRSLVVALAAALAVATLAIFAAEARAAGSFAQSPPKAILMKDSDVLQTQWFYWAHWYYFDEEDGWVETYQDFVDVTYPRADVVGAGRRLHVRFYKPERPSAVEIRASARRHSDQWSQLKRSFGRVERDGKTVAWDVFFRVNEPERDYYIQVYPVWDQMPGTKISYGDEMFYKLYVRTRA